MKYTCCVNSIIAYPLNVTWSNEHWNWFKSHLEGRITFFTHIHRNVRLLSLRSIQIICHRSNAAIKNVLQIFLIQNYFFMTNWINYCVKHQSFTCHVKYSEIVYICNLLISFIWNLNSFKTTKTPNYYSLEEVRRILWIQLIFRYIYI